VLDISGWLFLIFEAVFIEPFKFINAVFTDGYDVVFLIKFSDHFHHDIANSFFIADARYRLGIKNL
jgi:hypothetical protein